MREIKFRAWLKIEKRMYRVHALYPLAEKQQVELEGKSLVFAFTIGESIELMQFTGLLDKNGKEIYESDIVQCYALSYQVKFDDFINMQYLKERLSELEVIGNIYENPELLKITKPGL